MDNKTRTKHFFVMLALFIYASLTVGTVATALNSLPGPFFTVVGLLMAAGNVAMCVYVGKRELKDN